MRSPDDLRKVIDGLGVEAQVLIVRAQQEELKRHVRQAQQDLTEALTLLDQSTRSLSPELSLSVVDASVKSAKLRLDLVETALRHKGPHATDLS